MAGAAGNRQKFPGAGKQSRESDNRLKSSTYITLYQDISEKRHLKK